jgi:hypothetical protein
VDGNEQGHEDVLRFEDHDIPYSEIGDMSIYQIERMMSASTELADLRFRNQGSK